MPPSSSRRGSRVVAETHLTNRGGQNGLVNSSLSTLSFPAPLGPENTKRRPRFGISFSVKSHLGQEFKKSLPRNIGREFGVLIHNAALCGIIALLRAGVQEMCARQEETVDVPPKMAYT